MWKFRRCRQGYRFWSQELQNRGVEKHTMSQISKKMTRTENGKGYLGGLLRGIYSVCVYLQITMFLALLTLVALNLGLDGNYVHNYKVFVYGLFILVPVVSTHLTERRLKSLGLYLVLNFLAVGIMTVLYYGVFGRHKNMNMEVSFVIMLFQSVFLIADGFRRRLQAADRQRLFQNVDDTVKLYMDNSILFHPGYVIGGLFVLVYVIGLILENPYLSDIALVCTILYFFSSKYCIWFEEVNQYLLLHKRVANRPEKRIVRITGGMMAVFFAAVFMFALLALATGSNRHYMDPEKVKWRPIVPKQISDYFMEEEKQSNSLLEIPEEQLASTNYENTLFDKIVLVLVFVGGGLFVCFLVGKGIVSLFRDFREGVDENGDLVEKIEDQDIQNEGGKPFSKRNRQDRNRPKEQREQIRWEFRRLVRKHRKEIPYSYETPREIEIAAGLIEREDIKELHQQYEWARYAPEE